MRLSLPLLATFATACTFACSDSSEPRPYSATFDAGVDASLELPADLAACDATPAPTLVGSGSTKGFNIQPSVRVHLGDLVRDGRHVPTPLYVPAPSSRDVNNVFLFVNNAAPVQGEAENPFAELLRTDAQSSRFSFMMEDAQAAQPIHDYVALAKQVNATDVFQRTLLFHDMLTQESFSKTPATPAPEVLAGDNYVFALNGLNLFDATVIIRFSQGGACHLANLWKLSGAPELPIPDPQPKQFTLKELVVASEKHPLMLRYLRERAPAAAAMTTWLGTNMDPKTPPPPACNINTLQGCTELLVWLDARASDANEVLKVLKAENLSSPETLPHSFIQGRIEFSPVR